MAHEAHSGLRDFFYQKLGRENMNLLWQLKESLDKLPVKHLLDVGAGIRISKNICLLNSDTEVQKGSLEKLVSYLDNYSGVAAVAPDLLNPDGTRQIEYYLKLPTYWRIFLLYNIILHFLVMKSPLRYLLVTKSKEIPFEVDHLAGAALMTRKEVFQATDGLDEDYTFLFEDVEFGWQVKKQL